MLTHSHTTKPVRGMTMAFKQTASQSLAGIPATIVDIWPRFRSGDYLVTLEYATPVKFRKALIRHIDAFISELDTIDAADQPRAGSQPNRRWFRPSVQAV